MWNVLVFAVIGLFAGAAARLLYPGRQARDILGTILLGIVGAVLGGLLSWNWWPSVELEFQTGNLIFAVVGGLLLVMLRAVWVYARSVGGSQSVTPR